MSVPNQIYESRIPRTLMAFKTMKDYFDFFDAISFSSEIITNSDESYKDVADAVERFTMSSISENDIEWLGEPMPSSIEAARSRRAYQNMAEYDAFYKNIVEPRLQDLIKRSEAALQIPVMKYNDRELGVFDFNKASGGLQVKYKYYSLKEKKYVDGSECWAYKKSGKNLIKLKSDGSPVVLVPQLLGDYDKEKAYEAFKKIHEGANVFNTIKKFGLKIGGQEAFTSRIKKAYLYKEKVPKRKSAVRIFCKIGQNCNITNEQYKWQGYLAIGLSELLSLMGYAVSIFGVYGNRQQINYKGELQTGERYISICLKDFDENIDKSSLLYATSDLTFFRVRIFDNLIKCNQHYQDYIDTSLGSMTGVESVKEVVYDVIGRRDGLFTDKGIRDDGSQFLYYVIGDVFSEQDVIEKILDIALNVINENRLASDRLSDADLIQLRKTLESKPVEG